MGGSSFTPSERRREDAAPAAPPVPPPVAGKEEELPAPVPPPNLLATYHIAPGGGVAAYDSASDDEDFGYYGGGGGYGRGVGGDYWPHPAPTPWKVGDMEFLLEGIVPIHTAAAEELEPAKHSYGDQGRCSDRLHGKMSLDQADIHNKCKGKGLASTDLDKDFSAASAFVAACTFGVPEGPQLRLYGLYKIATEGPCTAPQPSALELRAHAKWNSWNKLGAMPPEEAMEEYITAVRELYPSWVYVSDAGKKHEETIVSASGSKGPRPVSNTNESNAWNKLGAVPAEETMKEYITTVDEAVQGAGSVIPKISYLMALAFRATVPEFYAEPIVEVSMTPATGDYNCFNTVGHLWSLVKGSGTSFKTSNALGEAIAKNLPTSEIIESTFVTGPGFVHIVLSNSWIAKRIQDMLVNGIKTWAPILPVKRVVIDFSSPSIAKEMHVGHLRPTIIGDALAHMFEFSNVEVLRRNHVVDCATQFGMLIEFLFEKYPNWEELGSQAIGNLQEFYKASKQRFDEDAEFKDRAQQAVVRLQGEEEKYCAAWKMISDIRRNELDQVYKLLDVQLEEKEESFYIPYIPQVLEQLSREEDLIEEIKGDRVIFIEGYQTPLVLIKRDGGFHYALTELAALSYWLNVEKVEWIIYVTDVGHWQRFDKFFQAARMAGWLPDPKEKKFPKTSHAELGLVLVADGEREFVLLRDLLDKAKTRSKSGLTERLTENGKIVDWTDEELEKASEAVGYGAVKYTHLINNDPTNYKFTLGQILSEKGNTAVYLQYAHAHACFIIRKSKMDVEELKVSGNISLAHQDERVLGLHLIRYAEAVEEGCTKLHPSVLCEYLYKLSGMFTRFCANCPMVVGSPEEASRLLLCEATSIVMRQCFELLGITPVHKL